MRAVGQPVQDVLEEIDFRARHMSTDLGIIFAILSLLDIDTEFGLECPTAFCFEL